MVKSSALLNTEFGSGKLHVYEFPEGNYVSFVLGSIEGKSNVLVRIHDQCSTADLLHSNRCDCRQQRVEALRRISQEGSGLFIHTPLEGRAHGLLAKVKQYSIQTSLGLDTIEASRHLGYPDDLRDYARIPSILQDLRVHSIALLTGNPRKIAELAKLGIIIDGVLPLQIDGLSEEAMMYVRAKHKWWTHYQERPSSD